MYRTKDGSVWEPASTGLGRLEMTDIDVREDHLYAGNVEQHAASDDDGESWSSAPVDRRFFTLQTAKANQRRTTTEPGSYYRAGRDGVWRTTNGGKRWDPAGLQDVATTWVALQGGRLFALTSTGGLFASDDQGGHWRRRPPLPGGQRISVAAVSTAYVFALAADQRLYRAPR
ncbi:MAG: hypothetical protein ABGY41_22325 [Candidatus Poribacteria bacterium]